MTSFTCKVCAHFRQHYIIDAQRCARIDCGHCIYPRVKDRRPFSPACTHYEPAPATAQPNRKEVIHFLTTELLQHILNLELPPEIADSE